MIKKLIICFRKKEITKDYWLPIYLESKKDGVYEYVKRMISKKALGNKGLATSYWMERKLLFINLCDIHL